MTKRSIVIIGAGKAGTMIGKRLFDAGYHISAVISRTKKSAKDLGLLLDADIFSDSISVIPAKTKLVMLAVPDLTIKHIANELSKSNLNFASLNVFHLSGSLSADELLPLKKKGTGVFSIHPYQTLTKNPGSEKVLENITYGIEGDKECLIKAKNIVRSLKGNAVIIPKKNKALYHLSAVFVSNFLITLINSSDKMLAEFVNDGKKRKKILEPIIIQSVRNILNFNYEKILTGPVLRGDVNTVSRHLDTLDRFDKDYSGLYKSISNLILKFSGDRIPQPERKKSKNIFNSK